MTFSYTQIANYLRCPRSYRHRYLDGWREKETRAAMIFGRCFEKALESYFSGGDCGATLHREWGVFRDTPFEFKKGETWDRLVHQGCISSGALPRKIGFTFPSRSRTFKSKWCGSSRTQINLLPILTLSANSMANVVSWTGRPPGAGIPRNQPGCSRSILS